MSIKNFWRPSIRYLLLGLLAFLVALTARNGVTAQPAAASDTVEKILFIETNYDTHISILSMMDPDGKNVTPIVQIPNSVRDMRLSPDNTTIAFVGETGTGSGNLFLMNVNGTNQRRVKKPDVDYNDSGIAWSPDGKHLIYFVDGLGISTIDLDGTNEKVVPISKDAGLQFYNTPIWMSDGQHILFGAGKLGGQHLYLTTLDGTPITQFTDLTIQIFPYTSLSPDGSKVVFDAIADIKDMYSERLYVENIDGTDAHAITAYPPAQLPSVPVWSPDGQQIAYASPNGLTIMNADGSDPKVVLAEKPNTKYVLIWGLLPADQFSSLKPFQPLAPTPKS